MIVSFLSLYCSFISKSGCAQPLKGSQEMFVVLIITDCSPVPFPMHEPPCLPVSPRAPNNAKTLLL